MYGTYFPAALLAIWPPCFGAFAELRKAAISYVMSICLSVLTSARNNSAPITRIFMKFDNLSFSENVEKTEVSLKYDTNNGHFTWRPTYNLIISRSVILRMTDCLENRCRENQNKHFNFKKFFFFQISCCLWDNVEKYGAAREATDINIIRRTRNAWWIT
jgi:hypothetical protein